MIVLLVFLALVVFWLISGFLGYLVAAQIAIHWLEEEHTVRDRRELVPLCLLIGPISFIIPISMFCGTIKPIYQEWCNKGKDEKANW